MTLQSLQESSDDLRPSFMEATVSESPLELLPDSDATKTQQQQQQQQQQPSPQLPQPKPQQSPPPSQKQQPSPPASGLKMTAATLSPRTDEHKSAINPASRPPIASPLPVRAEPINDSLIGQLSPDEVPSSQPQTHASPMMEGEEHKPQGVLAKLGAALHSVIG